MSKTLSAEMRFAMALTSDSAQTKVASSLEQMSIEELEALVRGDAPAKVASVKKTASQKEALKLWAEETGRSMVKSAAVAGMVKNVIGRGMQAAVATPTATRAAVGAGVGAAAGAVKNPGVDPATGQKKSRIGGALAGAAVGAGAGVAAKPAAMALGSMNNQAGRIAGGALKATTKQTGNIAGRQAATQMQISRGAQMSAGRQAAGKPLHSMKPGAGGGTAGAQKSGVMGQIKNFMTRPMKLQSPIVAA